MTSRNDTERYDSIQKSGPIAESSKASWSPGGLERAYETLARSEDRINCVNILEWRAKAALQHHDASAG